MRLLHPPLLILLIVIVPVATAIECLNYRVPVGDPILKALRNPKCSSKAKFCVKITGSSDDGKNGFKSGRCEYPDECTEYPDSCFHRKDGQGKQEKVCCSSENFSNHGSSNSVITSIALFISLIILTF